MIARIHVAQCAVFGLSCTMLVACETIDEASAAVRLCMDHVTSEVFSAKSERDAKRAAIKDWTARAKARGAAHPSWRIASFKVLKCVPNSGLFDCVAYGAPCTIKQRVPLPKKPGVPTGAGAREA